MTSIAKLLVFLFIPVIISACASPEEIRRMQYESVRQQQVEARQKQIEEQQYITRLRNRCQGFGFQLGSNDFARCVQQLHAQNEQNEQNDAARRQAYMQQAVQQMFTPVHIEPLPAPARNQNQIKCTSKKTLFNTVETDCQ